WIKALRTLDVDGLPLRDRFTCRGDSLWWFAELYLHKQAVIERAWRAALALDTFCERERPSALEVRKGDTLLGALAPQAARRLGVRCVTTESDPRTDGVASSRLALDLKSRFYTWTALASHLRLGGSAGRSTHTGGTLAFVHSAFWRKPQPRSAQAHPAQPHPAQAHPDEPRRSEELPSSAEAADPDAGQEGYIGTVLPALQERPEPLPARPPL